jgi:hypothetical protein
LVFPAGLAAIGIFAYVSHMIAAIKAQIKPLMPHSIEPRVTTVFERLYASGDHRGAVFRSVAYELGIE